MKKEVLIAVLLGLGMGLVITYGFYRVKTTVSGPKTNPVLETATTSATENNSSVLSISSPLDGLVTTETTVTVSGTTVPGAFVVVFVNDVEQITNADATGNFSVAALLKSGANAVNVVVADNDGTTYSDSRVVIVSTLLDQDSSALTNDTDASGSAEAAASPSPKPSSKATPKASPAAN